MPDRPGIAARVFRALADEAVNVDMIVQNVSAEGHTDISFTVPKTDLATLNDVKPSQADVVGRLAVAAADYAKREGFAEDGYRIVINCNDHGGQTVFQVHLHLLAGAPLGRFGTPA